MPDDMVDAHIRGVSNALAAGWRVLERGGSALRAGGVGCVEHLRNPVRAARKILSESPHVYFVGDGAEKFAAEHGVPLCKNEDLIIPREIERLRQYQATQHGT